MNLIKEKNGDFCVVKIEGRFDTSNAAVIEAELDQLISSGEKNLLFDCSTLNYISSSGLRVFLATQKKIMGARGKLCLSNMQPSILEIFTISGFTNIFSIYETKEEALSQ